MTAILEDYLAQLEQAPAIKQQKSSPSPIRKALRVEDLIYPEAVAAAAAASPAYVAATISPTQNKCAEYLR